MLQQACSNKLATSLVQVCYKLCVFACVNRCCSVSRKNLTYLVTTCYQAVNKMRPHCFFLPLLTNLEQVVKLVTRLMTVTDLLQVCSNKLISSAQTVKISTVYTRKNAQVVTTCYQAVTRFIRTACSQLLTSLHKLLSTCNKLDDDCRLATSLFQQVDIVWMLQVVTTRCVRTAFSCCC